MDDPKVRARHKSIMSDPEFIAKTVASRKITFSTPEFKERISVAHKKAWENPVSKQKLHVSLKKSWDAPGVRVKQSERSLELWNDPNRRSEMIEAQKRGNRTEKAKKSKSDAMKVLWSDPKTKEKRKKKLVEVWTPEKRAAFSAACRARLQAKKAQESASKFERHVLTEDDDLQTLRQSQASAKNCDTESLPEAARSAAHTEEACLLWPSDEEL